MVKYRIIKKINRGITMNEQKARDLCMAIEPPYIDFIQQNYKTALKAMEWKEQQLIDKAWDWLTNQKGEHTKEDFIKAMKEEQ